MVEGRSQATQMFVQSLNGNFEEITGKTESQLWALGNDSKQGGSGLDTDLILSADTWKTLDGGGFQKLHTIYDYSTVSGAPHVLITQSEMLGGTLEFIFSQFVNLGADRSLDGTPEQDKIQDDAILWDERFEALDSTKPNDNVKVRTTYGAVDSEGVQRLVAKVVNTDGTLGMWVADYGTKNNQTHWVERLEDHDNESATANVKVRTTYGAVDSEGVQRLVAKVVNTDGTLGMWVADYGTKNNQTQWVERLEDHDNESATANVKVKIGRAHV